MATKDRQGKVAGPVARMRALHGAGDVRAARTLAWQILNDPNASPDDQDAAKEMRGNTEVDRKALAVGLGALGLAAVVIVFFLLS